MTIPKTNRIAVFIDAENVGQWIKQDGINLLLSELKALGQIVIRRAYGVWSRPQLAMHQAAINQQGFEMIHCYHPVTGKNTADIQMTVDVIECAWQLPNITCFVLVTGDSDFSPVFRRLREMDKEVIGVGRHSALSECVKTSCTRFIYTDALLDAVSDQDGVQPVPPPPQSPTIDDNALKAIQALIKQRLSDAGEAVNTSGIKSQLLLQEPEFNEMAFGFSNFTDFLKAIDGVILEKIGTVNYARLKLTKTGQPPIDTAEGYRSALKKHHFALIDAETVKRIYKQAVSNKVPCSDMASLKEAVFKASQALDSTLVKKTINQTFFLFIKLDLVHTDSTTSGIKIKKMALKDFLLRIDELMIATLLDLRKMSSLELKAKEIKKMTLSTISKDSIKKQISE